MKRSSLLSTAASLGVCVISLASCGAQDSPTPHEAAKAGGGISGVMSVDAIASKAQGLGRRSAALLGIFVSEYVSVAPAAMAAEGALNGIGVQMQIAIAQNTVQDPDFDLLQAFADALQVDVQDMLNRSTDRQQALDIYSNALRNVASRANDRFKELSSTLDELKDELRTLGKERSNADRDVKTALRNKDFTDAGEKQRILNDAQAAYAEKDLTRKQVEQLVTTLDSLLTIYGQKFLAIQSNREILISGAKVVDVPGIEDLKIIQKSTGAGSTSRTKNSFDQLFEGAPL